MAEVDSLTIKVVADTGNAVTSIKNVTRAVRELNDSASDRGWRSFTNSITRIGDASKGMGKLVSSLKRIEGMQISPSLKENLDKIADAGARLSGVGKGMYQFGYGLAKLSEAGKDSAQLGENLRRVSSHVIKFSQAISKFVPQDFAQKAASLRQLANTIKNFSKIGEDKDLAKKFNNVASAVGNFATSLNNAVSDEVLARLERIAQALTDISKAAGAAASTVKKVEKTSATASQTPVTTAIKWQSIVKAAETANKTLAEIGQGLYGVIDASGIVADLDRISGAVIKNIPILGELTDAWKEEAAEVKSILLSQASIVDKAADLMLVKVKHIIKLLYSFAKLPFSSASMSATKGIIGMVATPLKNLGKTITELTKKWDQFIASISRIAIYRLLRTALKEIAAGMKEGIQNLYQWAEAWRGVYSSADKFLSSMDQLATAFFYLKNSVGAAVSPLIDYVAPIIDALIDKFVMLANAINQAMAALTGAGVWRKAIKYPITYSEAAGLASSKVKDLKRSVLGFDELNRLDDKNKGGGGSHKWEAPYSELFEESPVDSALAALLNSPTWRGLGNMIAQKINEALESINWVKVQETVKKWSRRLGSLFDEILLDLNMPLVGTTLAEGLNTIADAINSFFDEFHWVTIGQHLSDGFESMIDTLRWGDIGRALTQKWKALFELVIGFKDVDLTGLGKGIVDLFVSAIENVPVSDFVDAIATLLPKIGKELGVAINGIIEQTNKTVSGINAEGLGSAFGMAIENMIAGIDAKQAGIFLTNGIKKIIEFTSGLIKTMPWDDLNTALAELITSAFTNIDLKTGIQNAIDIATKIVGLLTTAIDSIPWEEVGAAIEGADTTALKEGLKGLLESVVDGLERAGVLDEVAEGVGGYMALKLGSSFAKVLPSILTFKAASGLLTGAGAGTAGGAAGGAAAGMSLLSMFGITAAGVTAGAALGQQFSHKILGPLLEGFGAADADLYKNWTFFGEDGMFAASLDYSKMKVEDFENVLSGFGESHRNLWDSIKNNDWESSIHGIGEAWKTEHPIISSGLDLINEKLGTTKAAFEGAEETIKGFSDGTKHSFEQMSQSIGKSTDHIASKMSGLVQKIKGSLGEINQSFASMKGFSLDVDVKSTNANVGKITKRAAGGVVDKGDLFIAGEAGPEIVTSYGGESAVMNMEQIIQTISASVAAASGGNITIPISLDGGLLDTIIVSAQQRQSLRSGA